MSKTTFSNKHDTKQLFFVDFIVYFMSFEMNRIIEDIKKTLMQKTISTHREIGKLF